MALQKFRDRQKMIYWVIALVVIPSFVLLGFSGIFMRNPAAQSVGTVFGKKISRAHFDQFRMRLRGANRGMPAYFGTLNPQNGNFQPITSEEVSAFILLALSEDAKRRGIAVTDNEIATFIRAQINYTGNDDREFRAKVSRELATRQIPLDDLFSYQAAVRETLQARKLLALIDDSVIVPLALAELQAARQNSTYTFQRAIVTVNSQKAAAETAIAALDDAALNERAEKFIAEKQQAKARDQFAFLWQKPRWQLDYLFVPLIVLGREPEISDARIADFYQANRDRYKKAVPETNKAAENKTGGNSASAADAANLAAQANAASEQYLLDSAAAHLDDEYRPLNEVREEIATELRRTERLATAQNTIDREFADFLRRRNQNAEKTAALPTIAEINADSRLQNLGAIAGSTGGEPQTAEQLFGEKSADENLRGMAIANFVLEMLDREINQRADAVSAVARTSAIDEFLLPYQRDFRGYALPGRNQEFPISSEKGLLKFRITKYVAGEPKTLFADGKRDDELFGQVKTALINELAEKQAMEKLAQLTENLRVGIADPEIKTETAKATEMNSPALAELQTLPLGAVSQPRAIGQPEAGFEAAKLLSVEIPPIDDDNPEVKAMQRYETFGARSNMPYAPELLPRVGGMILIGARAFNYFQENFSNGNFTFAPIYRDGGGDGHNHDDDE